MQHDDKSKVFREGEEARQLGKELDYNPYAENSLEFGYWQYGWYSMQAIMTRPTPVTVLDSAFELGAQSALLGVKRGFNPFDPKSPEWKLWNDGWASTFVGKNNPETETDPDFKPDTHIDDWISAWRSSDSPEGYAVFVLYYKRMSAGRQNQFAKWMDQFKLFCTWQGKTYRVTGASRLGDVWLQKDFNRDHGYDHRVDVTTCSNWKDKP
jgi:hypothetical protein